MDENERAAAKWVCTKCAREAILGFDDGQIPEHFRTCPKRPKPDRAPRSRGVHLISAERERQVVEEGYTAEHDAQHNPKDLIRAGICYAEIAIQGADAWHNPDGSPAPPGDWPWHGLSWNPADTEERNLVKAGALIAAAIDARHIQKEDCICRCGHLYHSECDESCTPSRGERLRTKAAEVAQELRDTMARQEFLPAVLGIRAMKLLDAVAEEESR